MLILATSAEIEIEHAMRRSEYERTARWLRHNAASHRVMFLECVAETGSFLEASFPVHYARCHDPSLRNKGVNLGRALLQFLRANPIDEALVLQMTGRYHFLDRSFLSAIEDHPDYDLYGREIDELSGPGLRNRRKQYFTGAFAMRTELLRRWLEETDFGELERGMINIERWLWEYAERERLSAFHVESVRMECNVFSGGTPELAVF
jgi:hypothetical protein